MPLDASDKTALTLGSLASIAVGALIMFGFADGGEAARRWWQDRTSKGEIWDAWKKAACPVARIERHRWGDTVCRLCKTDEFLIGWAKEEGISHRFEELGGPYALANGVTVCE